MGGGGVRGFITRRTTYIRLRRRTAAGVAMAGDLRMHPKMDSDRSPAGHHSNPIPDDLGGEALGVGNAFGAACIPLLPARQFSSITHNANVNTICPEI